MTSSFIKEAPRHKREAHICERTDRKKVKNHVRVWQSVFTDTHPEIVYVCVYLILAEYKN